jgi:His-Xaa-Ser system protein HxsD
MADVLVEFDRSTQSLGALREAAYRIIREASCQIDATSDRYRCRLTPKDGLDRPIADGLRERFLDLVTDENLRDKVATETGAVRDVILALAFGALASGEGGTDEADEA